MSHSASSRHFPQGVIVPVITPVDEAGAVDFEAYGRVLAHVIAGGVDAVFALGTTGEGPSFSGKEQQAILRHTCEHSPGCPVYAGITHTSRCETLRLIEQAHDCGAVAAVVAPPAYYPLGTREQVAYFESLAASTALPLILYNIPQMTKTALSLEAFKELLPHPAFIGIKDSSGQMVYFRRLQHLATVRPDFSLLVGADELLADAVLLGAHGGVTGGANVAPRLFKDLYLAAVRGDLAVVQRLRRQVMEISCRLYTKGNGGYIIQSLKSVLQQQGLSSATVRLPLLTASEPEEMSGLWELIGVTPPPKAVGSR